MIDEIKLAKGATKALVEHVGVAAEFVVGDALRQLRAAPTYRRLSDAADLGSFFAKLRGLVPADVPFEAVRRDIVKHYEGASTL